MLGSKRRPWGNASRVNESYAGTSDDWSARTPAWAVQGVSGGVGSEEMAHSARDAMQGVVGSDLTSG